MAKKITEAHDINNLPLATGDRVFIRAKVVKTTGGDVELETTEGPGKRVKLKCDARIVSKLPREEEK